MLTEKLRQIAQLKSKLTALEEDLLKGLRSISSSEDLVGALGGIKKAPKRRARRKARPKAAKKVAKKSEAAKAKLPSLLEGQG